MARTHALAACQAVYWGSLLAIGVWLLWYGKRQFAGYDCKILRQAIPNGAPASWMLTSACAFNWNMPLLRANLGFLCVAPAAAAFAAIAVMGLNGQQHTSSTGGGGTAARRSWSAIHLPPTRFWLWLCDGLTVKDALLVLVWAAYNAVWYSAILPKATNMLAPGMRPSPRGYAKGFASLMMPNLVPLLFPVSRGSVINHVLGLSYPEGIRYHRWLGQWVMLLTSLHGLIYWISWAVEGRWLNSALRHGQETNNLLGGIALMFTLMLWATSQLPVRRACYSFYKVAHHIGFWGFMLIGCAHHWALFWYFVPGMLLYAVDGVFRLHQMLTGRGGDLMSPGGTSGDQGSSWANAEVLQVEVDSAGTMCSLLLASPGVGIAPVGVVWLNVPQLSWLQWHAFDYTACEVALDQKGRVVQAGGGDKASAEGRQVTAMAVHIKGYHRWTKDLITKLVQGGQPKLTIRLQGPYADPPASHGQPDGVVLVAGGNGIASALPALEELSEAGVMTQGLPALLLWVCRKGHEFTFMAAPVVAAARALGLNLTVQLYITDHAHMKPLASATAASTPCSTVDADTSKDHTTIWPTLDISATATSSSGLPSFSSSENGAAGAPGGAAPTSLCPVVALTSWAAQLSFKAILHLAVFGGFLAGLAITIHVAVTMPQAAGRRPWETLHLGLALVLICAGCAVGLGLVTLWIGLAVHQVKRAAGGAGGAPRMAGWGPAAAVAANLGHASQLLPADGGLAAGKAAAGKPAGCLLQVPRSTGQPDTFKVNLGRPNVEGIIHGWLATVQQLPAAALGCDQETQAPGKLHCLVYGCGPTALDHATQMAVARAGAQKDTAGRRAAQLEFVRKAQML